VDDDVELRVGLGVVRGRWRRIVGERRMAGERADARQSEIDGLANGRACQSDFPLWESRYCESLALSILLRMIITIDAE